MNSLKEVNFETISLNDLKKRAEPLTRLELRDSAFRLSKYRKSFVMPALATNAECIEIREALIAKENLLASIIQRKEVEEKLKRDDQEMEFSKETARRHVFVAKDIRSCSDSIITRMQNLGTEHVPVHSVEWTTPTTTKISVLCQSGKTRTLDLEKISPAMWRHLEQPKMIPAFIIAEPAGMLDGKGDPVPLWSNQKDFAVVHAQKQVSATVVALMLV